PSWERRELPSAYLRTSTPATLRKMRTKCSAMSPNRRLNCREFCGEFDIGPVPLKAFHAGPRIAGNARRRRDYNASMSIRTTAYLDAIAHLPEGATLVFNQISWDEYERLLEDLWDRPQLRLTYDCGKLEIMSPLFEHDEYASFIDDLVRALSE